MQRLARIAFGLLAVSCFGAAAFAQLPPQQSPVAGLRELLHVEDASVRLMAAEGLSGVPQGVMGLPAQAAVMDLLRVFEDDKDRAVATMAAEALAVSCPWPLGVFEFVGSRIEVWAAHGADPDAVERLRIVLRQPERQWFGTASAPWLVRIAKTPACASGALGALAMLGEDGAAAAPDLAALFATVAPKERWRAAFTLACVGGHAGLAMPEGRGSADEDLQLWLVRARCRCEPPTAELARLVSPWLSHARAPVRRWAMATAEKLGPAFGAEVERVVGLLGEPLRRHEAMRLLWALGPQAAPAVPALLARLREPSPVDELECMGTFELFACIGHGAERAADALLEFAKAPKPVDPVAAQLVEQRAAAAVGALAAIAPERAVAALWPGVAEAPRDADPATWHRVHRFACLGPAAVAALPQLRMLLAVDDRLASARALLVLSRIGPAAAPVANDLVRWLRSDDEYLRWLALRTVWSIGEAASSLLPELTALFERVGGNHRTDAMREAGRLGPAAELLLLRALRTGESWTRRIAAEQLLKASWASAPALDAVLACLDDEDELLRQHVFTQLCVLPARAATANVQARRLLGSTKDPSLRQACIDPLWRSMLRPMGRDRFFDWGGYEDPSALLGRWRGDPPPGDVAAVFADEKNLANWVRSLASAEDPVVRRQVAAALGRLPGSVPSLHVLEDLAADPETSVRREAVAAIGRQGSAASASAPLLARALHDPDWYVKVDAAHSLRAVLHHEPQPR